MIAFILSYTINTNTYMSGFVPPVPLLHCVELYPCPSNLFFFLGGGFDTCVTIQSGFWPCALNGQEALAMLEETHQKDSDYEVILTDWMLPGMDYHTSKPIDVNKVAELLRKYMS